jgi:hypothetical protein
LSAPAAGGCVPPAFGAAPKSAKPIPPGGGPLLAAGGAEKALPPKSAKGSAFAGAAGAAGSAGAGFGIDARGLGPGFSTSLIGFTTLIMCGWGRGGEPASTNVSFGGSLAKLLAPKSTSAAFCGSTSGPERLGVEAPTAGCGPRAAIGSNAAGSC